MGRCLREKRLVPEVLCVDVVGRVEKATEDWS